MLLEATYVARNIGMYVHNQKIVIVVTYYKNFLHAHKIYISFMPYRVHKI